MKNILFLSIDDLNDWTNALGGYSGKVITPNLDALMASGVTFNNAYAQVAICNPSRTSVLTGKSPLKTGVFGNHTDWESTVDPAETLFGVMKANGYESVGVGKLFHTGASEAAKDIMFDSEVYLGHDQTGINLDGKPVGPYNGTEPLTDDKRADYIVDFLQNYSPNPNKPLLLSAGFLKPHTEWVVPQEFFDLYPLDSIQIDAVPNDVSDIPQFALDNAGQKYPWSHDDVPDLLTWKKLVQAYLAAISYMDSQVGKVLEALDNSAIAENTSVVLWSDHGYHLGDKDKWHKFTLWDNAAKAPLIISDPDFTNPGTVIDDVVELMDIFPTVLDIANVSDSGLELDGKSLIPKINGTSDPSVPNRAFTWMYGSVSIRTDEYRYTIYEDGSEELYDVVNDPELIDNLVEDLSLSGVKSELNSILVSEFNLIGYGVTDAVLNGTDNNDVFAVGNANQTANGGDGDDIYFVNGDTSIVENESAGRDMIVTSDKNYTMPDNVEVLEVKGFSQEIYGNEIANLIAANADLISSGDGDDSVRAGSWINYIYLGTGNDSLISYAGKDTVYGGIGDDSIRFYGDPQLAFGEGGNDKIVMGFGNDTADGGAGNDSIFGQGDNDLIEGGLGDDFLYSGIGDDTAYGGEGNDSLLGEWGEDLLSGGAGADTLEGNQNSDYIYGGWDNDLIDGGAGDDFLYSGIGDDTVYGGEGNDSLLGEWGEDLLSGGAGADTLEGNQNSDYIYGGWDNDLIDGGAGDDFLYLGIGDDTAYGGEGNDSLRGEWGEDLLSGGAGADTLEGNENSDIFAYTSADDSLINQPDTIIDFAVGSDKLWLDFPDFAPTEIGSVSNISEANTYFDGSSIQVAFSAAESILYVDSSAQGLADMAITLRNVTSLSLADLV